MNWLHLRMESLAALIMVMQMMTIRLAAEGSKVGFFFASLWSMIIFFIVWYGLVKRVESSFGGTD